MLTRPTPEGELPEDFDVHDERNFDRVRDEILEEICDLLEASGAVTSRSKLFRDLQNREKKAGTAVGGGVAIPHVRTLQAREFAMCFARSGEGLPFRAPDGEPVRLFFGLVAPPYEDRQYLRVYASLAGVLRDAESAHELLSAEEPSEVLRTLETFR